VNKTDYTSPELTLTALTVIKGVYGKDYIMHRVGMYYIWAAYNTRLN